MANPFLVLGGVAVGIVVAAAGVLTVPGWITSAQDASAVNDLASVAAGEAAAVSVPSLAGYMTGAELAENAGKLGMSFTTSAGVKICVTRSADRKQYAAVASSPSGSYFARTPKTTKSVKGATAAAALTAVGGLPDGVTDPVLGSDCAPGADLPGSGGPSADGGGAIPPAPLGATTTMGRLWGVAYTAHGVYSIDMNGVITRSGPDSKAHAVAFTGPAAGKSFDRMSMLRADAKGNLYVVDENERFYRIAPDGSSTDITPDTSRYGGEGEPDTLAIDGFGVSPAGQVYYFGWGYAQDGDDFSVKGVWKHVSGTSYTLVRSTEDLASDAGERVDDVQQMAVAGDGTAYLLSYGTVYKVAPDGTGSIFSQGQDIQDVAIHPNGKTLYAANYDNLLTYAADGVATPFAGIQAGVWSAVSSLAVGSDGAAYHVEYNYIHVVRTGMDGVNSIIAAN